MKKTAQEPEAITLPAFIPCTRQQEQVIIAFNERFQSAHREMQGVIYQAAVALGIDLGKYEFNAQQLGFVRKP